MKTDAQICEQIYRELKTQTIQKEQQVIDITKKYKTRDGQEVELISDKGRGLYPIKGYVGNRTDISSWSAVGQHSLGGIFGILDLVEVKDPIILRCWVNFYTNGESETFHTKGGADKYAQRSAQGLGLLRMGEAIEVINVIE